MAYALNIHEFYNELKDAGFNEKQAEVIANIQSKTSLATIEQTKHDLHLDDIATKRDLKDLELKIKDTELRIIAQLSTMQQDIQVTKLTNRALVALCSVIAGALIKIAFF
jgi:flagellar capping protein FliD